MKSMITGIAALAAIGSVASAAPTPVTQNDVPSFSTLQTAFSLTEINLSTQGIAGLSGPASNTFVSNFSSINGVNTGVLTSEVFANVGTPGTGVSDVVIRYTFENTSSFGNVIEGFDFGVDTGAALDAGDIQSAVHGRILDADTSASGINPAATIDPLASSPVFQLALNDGGNPVLSPGESFQWYIRAGGDVAVSLVDVNVVDFEDAKAQAISFVDLQGQPDLNVPTPGTAVLAVAGVLVASRRRRA